MEIWWDINNRWMSRIWRRVQYCWPPKWTTLAKIYSCRCPVRISPLLVGRPKKWYTIDRRFHRPTDPNCCITNHPSFPFSRRFPSDFPSYWISQWFPSDFPVISHPLWFSHGFFGGSSRLPGPGGALQLKKSSYATQFLGGFLSAFHLVSWPGKHSNNI